MIYKMAIVDDELSAVEELETLIERYERENAPTDEFHTSVFTRAQDFLSSADTFDVAFLDICMDDIDGMQTARELRRKDGDMLIVFVTNMAQYAVESYEVHACDFILKPLSYGNFFMRFRHILKQIEHKSGDVYCTLSSRAEHRRVRVSDILYVESNNHNLIFHMTGGEDVRITSTLGEWETILTPHHFVRCNSCFLVNLRHIDALRGEYVSVGGTSLHISRSRKQQFMSDFARYVGGSK